MSTDAATTDAADPATDSTPVERPRTIDLAVLFTLVRVAMIFVSAAVYRGHRGEVVDLAMRFATKVAQKKGTTPPTIGQVWAYYPPVGTIMRLAIPFALVLLALAWFMRQGKSWAKWLLVIVSLLSSTVAIRTPDLLKVFSVVGQLPGPIATVEVISGVATVASLVCMFLRPSSLYFKARSPKLSLLRTHVDNPAGPNALADVGDTDVSTAIRRKPETAKAKAPKAKSRKAATEEK